jgi:hypothetical protein
MTKRHLKLFIERIDVDLPRVQIVGRTEEIPATFENKTAVRTDGVLTAEGSWLPGTCLCKNYRASLYLKACEGVSQNWATVKEGRSPDLTSSARTAIE